MSNSNSAVMLNFVQNALDDMKAQEMLILDVKDITTVTDYMVIVSGTSTQHLKSIINHVRSKAKELNIEVVGAEGEDAAEWILLDLGDIVVHAMLPEVRDYYQLEKLWSVEPIQQAASA